MKASRLTKVCFFLYSAIMLWLLFFQRIGTPSSLSYREALTYNINLIPFLSIKRMLFLVANRPGLRFFALQNLVGNVLLFIPLGTFLPGIFSKLSVFWRFLLVLTGILLSVELIQLFTLLGFFDVDDLILNLLGGLFGFFLWRISHFQGKKA